MPAKLPLSPFSFNDYRFSRYHHSDMRRGSPYHFFAYMREGFGRIEAEDTQIVFSQGDFLYIPKGLPYQSFWQGEGLVRLDSFGFSHFPFPSCAYPLQCISASREALDLVNQLYQNKAPSCRTLGLFYLLIDSLLPSMEKVPQNLKTQIVLQAEAYMEDHLSALIPQVAHHCGVSESGLYAAFREARGYTPVFARQKIQSAKAVQLLVTTDMPVEEIGMQLGFHSPAYFRRIFLKHTGKRPGDIRKESLL